MNGNRWNKDSSKCYRVYILDLINEGLINSDDMVEMLVRWSTSDDMKEMLQANDIDLNIV